MKAFALPSALLGLIAAIAMPVFAQTGDLQDLGTILSSNKNLTTYYELIQKYPNILLQLPNYSGVTIMAPNNDAFTKYRGWSNDNETLVTNILEYHILQGTVSAGAIKEGTPYFAATLLKDKSYTNVTGGQRLIINKQPGNTVVITSGEGSRSTVLEQDLTFTGGLVQVIDTLLVPPARLEKTARDDYQDVRAFLGAAYDAGLASKFAETPNVTIFAPYNAAFQLLSGTLSALPKDALARVLSYHIVPNALLGSPDLKNGTNLTTLATDASGASPVPIRITQSGNNRYIDSAQLVQPDILVANGVVHIIDNVLNPDAAAVVPNPQIGTQPPVFQVSSGASATGTGADVPFTTFLPCTSDCPVTTTSAAANSTATDAGAAGAGTRTTGGSSAALSTSKSKGAGAAAAARCTGLMGAAGVVGMMGVAAVL